MSNNTLHKLGIDIGSTTVKVAVLDENDNLLFSDYERHFANIRETLSLLVTSFEFVKRTRATLRIAELGFLGVVV